MGKRKDIIKLEEMLGDLSFEHTELVLYNKTLLEIIDKVMADNKTLQAMIRGIEAPLVECSASTDVEDKLRKEVAILKDLNLELRDSLQALLTVFEITPQEV